MMTNYINSEECYPIIGLITCNNTMKNVIKKGIYSILLLINFQIDVIILNELYKVQWLISPQKQPHRNKEHGPMRNRHLETISHMSVLSISEAMFSPISPNKIHLIHQ